jgi:hypothetical protein
MMFSSKSIVTHDEGEWHSILLDGRRAVAAKPIPVCNFGDYRLEAGLREDN